MPDASEQLHQIARALRAGGNGGAMKFVSRAIRAAAKPLADDVKKAAADQLPQRGGLARRVAKERVTVSVRTGARTAGVRLLQRNHDAKATNAGYVRHPTFGHRPWKTQDIPRARGWWSDTLRARSDEVTPDVERAMEEAAREIERGYLT